MRFVLAVAPLLSASVVALTSSGEAVNGPLKGSSNAIPSTGKEWFSLEPGVEFQPAADSLHRVLQQGDDMNYISMFADGAGTYWDDYQQAWRYLGFYIDCNSEEGGGNSGSQDNNNGQNGAGCPRYVMWAAYVDPDYGGEGLGEYQFFNRGTWDRSSCIASSGRCVKMDCHLPNTNFQLLGLFKDANYPDWFEQLFKHEGACVWNEDDYEFMQSERAVWPEKCTATGIQDVFGHDLYIDLKPLSAGDITVGVYTDEKCTQDYSGWRSERRILRKYVNSGYSSQQQNDGSHDDNEYGGGSWDADVATLKRHIHKWNHAMNSFKICQPCRAYNLDWDENDENNENDEGGGASGDEDENGNYFVCQDDADYTNVNQCMKFKSKVNMEIAFINDLRLASEQATILKVNMAGQTFGSNKEFQLSKSASALKVFLQIFWVLTSIVVLGVGSLLFHRAWTESKKTTAMKSPLIESEGVMT